MFASQAALATLLFRHIHPAETPLVPSASAKQPPFFCRRG
jgi:hypothetical protein